MPRQAAVKKPSREPRIRKRPRPRPVSPPADCTLGRYAVVIFWSNEDECFMADLPDFEFCSAHGDTPEEALAEIQVALELTLETSRELGYRIPRASFGPAVWNW